MIAEQEAFNVCHLVSERQNGLYSVSEQIWPGSDVSDRFVSSQDILAGIARPIKNKMFSWWFQRAVT